MESHENSAVIAWFLLLLFLSSVSHSFSQTVTFSVRDQSNNRFFFDGETNIELICEYSGFINVPSVEITYENTVIAQGPNTLSGNYTVQADSSSTILTIKMASVYTSGLYTCLISDNDLGLTKSMSVDFEVLTLLMGPRCWSSLPTEGGIFTGESFSADCFYSDTNDAFEGEWIKVSPNGTENPVTSTEMVLPGKKKQTITVPSVAKEDDGVLYKCSVNHKVTTFIRLTPCEIGPLIVSATTTTILTSSYGTSLLSKTTGREEKTTKLTTRRPKAKVTEDLEHESALEDFLIYVIIGVTVVVFVFIVTVISICICCCKGKNSKEPAVSKKDPEKVSNVYTTDVKLEPSWVYDTSPTEVKPGAPVYDLPPFHGRIGDNTIGLQNAANQSPDDVEYHNIGLSLDEDHTESFVPPESDMASTHL